MYISKDDEIGRAGAGIQMGDVEIDLKKLSENVLVLGSTGSGKTNTVVLPLLNGLMGNGFGGWVVDVKNNLTANVRRIASRQGRLDDIIEIGDIEGASSVNLLNGMEEDVFNKLVEEGLANYSGSDSAWWVARGMALFKDLSGMYWLLHKHGLVDVPTLYIFSKLLKSQKVRDELYYIFKKNKHLYMVEFEEMVETIFDGVFGLFVDEELRDGDKIDEMEKDKQLTWTIGQVSQYFHVFSIKENIERFSNIANEDFKLDFKNLFFDNKKVLVLRFSHQADSDMVKMITGLVSYKAKADIIAHDSKDDVTFRVVDEFHIVADPKHDREWLSMSREFGNINILATQSIDSLVSEIGYKAFPIVDNCKNKFFLNCNNPVTMKYFSQISLSEDYEPGLRLKKLKKSWVESECVFNDGQREEVLKLPFEFIQKLSLVELACKEEEGGIYQDIVGAYERLIKGRGLFKLADSISGSFKFEIDIEGFIEETGISKPNGLVTGEWQKEFWRHNKNIKDYLGVELFKDKNPYSRKYSQGGALRINIVKPGTEDIILSDFINNFNCSLKGVVEEFGEFKKQVITDKDFIDGEFDVAGEYKEVFIFLMDGMYKDVIAEHAYLSAIKTHLNKADLSYCNILALGHSDFVHPINLMCDFSYNTPSDAGTRVVGDLIGFKADNGVRRRKLGFRRVNSEYFIMEMKFKRVQIGVDALKDEIEGMGDTEKKQQCMGRVELMRAELDQIEKVVFKTGDGDE